MNLIYPKESTKLLNGIWISLLVLTGVSYGLAESAEPVALSTPLVLGIACLKAVLIGAVFMELRHCSKLLLAGFALFFVCLSFSLALCFY